MKKLIAVLGPLMLSVPLFAQIVRQTPIAEPVDYPVPPRCHNVVVYQRGLPDNFALPIDPVYPSAPLAAMLAGGPHVAYDQASCDVWFGDSFNLDGCVVCGDLCGAMLEITLRGCGSSLDCNDEITVGQAPFGKGGAGVLLWQGKVNTAGCSGTGGSQPNDHSQGSAGLTGKRAASPASTPGAILVKQIPLDLDKLRELVCKRRVTALDVFIEDDEIVDSMRLVITRP